MKSARAFRTAILVGGLACCGGSIQNSSDGRDSGAPSADGGFDASGLDAAVVCGGSGGAALICGREGTPCACGPSADSCANGPPGCDCAGSAGLYYGSPNDISVCVSNLPAGASSSYYNCADGQVMVEAPTSQYHKAGDENTCVPFEVGDLYTKNGWGQAVRYTDWTTFTDDPLPESTSCPTIAGIQLCGGACGDCPTGEVCTGRSPSHPYSVCLPIPASTGTMGNGCGSDCVSPDLGLGCFAFAASNASTDDQALAKAAWNCVPADWCQAAAVGLPGGGACDVPPTGNGCLPCFQ